MNIHTVMGKKGKKGRGRIRVRGPDGKRRRLDAPRNAEEMIPLVSWPEAPPVKVDKGWQKMAAKAASMEAWSGNRYSGFTVSSGWKPEVIEASSLSPEEFYEKYVKTRTPVILDGVKGLGDWKGASWIENDCKRLKEIAVKGIMRKPLATRLVLGSKTNDGCLTNSKLYA